MTTGLVGVTSTKAPNAASLFGMNKLVFFDDFLDLSKIDINNTNAAGFNWYMLNWDPWQGSSGLNVPSQPGWFSVSNSVLTVSTNNSTGQGGSLMTRGYLGVSNPRTIGAVAAFDATKGLYVESKLKFTIPTGSQTFIPDFWLEDVNGILGQIDNTASGMNSAEIDVFEVLQGSNSIQQTVHQWTGASANQQNGMTADLSGKDLSQFHKWGILIVPKSLNGGTTGFVRWYFDGIPCRPDVTWTAGTAFNCCELAQYQIMYGAGVNTPISIDSIEVWTTP